VLTINHEILPPDAPHLTVDISEYIETDAHPPALPTVSIQELVPPVPMWSSITESPQVLEDAETAHGGSSKQPVRCGSPRLHTSRHSIYCPQSPNPPNPKRLTPAQQKLQHKKLSTPFRSPLVKIVNDSPKSIYYPPASSSNDTMPKLRLDSIADTDQPKKTSGSMAPPAAAHVTSGIPLPPKKHTKKAAAQFKSPLSTTTSSTLVSSVRLTPTIQTLERKVQILKRAIKVRTEGEERDLQALVAKWREAGREVAWEVWELVKDRAGDGARSGGQGGWGRDQGGGEKRGLEQGWGWDDKENAKRPRLAGEEAGERNWGWSVPAYGDVEVESEDSKDAILEPEEDDKKQDTLGTMLRQLGIDPDTFGWDEEEGTFAGE
jgi:hypothetical protein